MTRRILPDVFAFGAGLGMAYFLKWETTDLVWSLWLSSLTLGYLTILSAIGGGAYLGIRAITHKDFKKPLRLPAALIGIAIGLFFLGFFSIHFCGFHAGHSAFLSHFFPLKGLPNDGFGAAFMNPPLLWLLVFRHLMKPYGLFLIPMILAERRPVFQPFIQAVNTVRGEKRQEQNTRTTLELFMKASFSRPYVNVVRMHLLIFFFAFSQALKVNSFLVYAVVYSVYFFPWSEVRKLTGKR